MTGVPADADDVVQESFVRALATPPKDQTKPWAPWLTRVTINLAIDRLRRRRQNTYTGPWLPAPIESDLPDIQFEQNEQVNYAFLRAMEVLPPKQRAILVLRDVMGYSSEEVAEFLDISPADARTSLSRAKKKLSTLPFDPFISPTTQQIDAQRSTLAKMMETLSHGDVEAFTDLLIEDSCCATDGGGQYRAALHEMSGRDRVAALLFGIAKKNTAPEHIEERIVNGFPALFVRFPYSQPRAATRVLVRIELARNNPNKIAEIHMISADDKLQRTRWSELV